MNYYLERPVSEEMDLLKFLILNMPQTVRLVPAVWKNVERDLPADRECEPIVCEFLTKNFHESVSDSGMLNEKVSNTPT